MIEGLVLWGVKSIYYVLEESSNKQYKCTIKGKVIETDFNIRGRKEVNPIVVGDKVEFEITNENEGIITKRKKRKNEFKRLKGSGRLVQTLFANIDYMIIIDSIEEPPLRPYFIDRCLFTAEYMGIEPIILFNKTDLITEQNKPLFSHAKRNYKKLGYKILETSLPDNTGIENLKKVIKGKLNSFYGRSGVGKSSLIQAIDPSIKNIKIGRINQKYDRGTHATTYAQIYDIEDNTLIIDNPGIRELSIFIDKEDDVERYIKDFEPYRDDCKYKNCKHINEPGCAVLKALEDKKLDGSRYESYLRIKSTVVMLKDSKLV